MFDRVHVIDIVLSSKFRFGPHLTAAGIDLSIR